MAKVAWPYLLSGAIHYRRRVLACAACSFVGMLVRVAFPQLADRAFDATC